MEYSELSANWLEIDSACAVTALVPVHWAFRNRATQKPKPLVSGNRASSPR